MGGGMGKAMSRTRVIALGVLAAGFCLASAGMAHAEGSAAAVSTGRSAAARSLLSLESLIALFTLTSLEVVLGIDNIIFIAILAGKLPESEREKARKLGLMFAAVSRILLLLVIGFVMQLKKKDLFTVFGMGFSGKDLILIAGGIFLIGKASYEIHHKIEAAGRPVEKIKTSAAMSLAAVLGQVMVVDIVFSLDSVITAVGMTPHIPVMIAAILASVAVMLLFSGYVVRFVDEHPTIKILALAFLILIGTLLVAEGFEQKIDKGYIYFAMAFSVVVDLLQMKAVPTPQETA
jgi:predicted tellurium resistance membrane protein TerC